MENKIYEDLQVAYKYYNKKLFDNKLNKKVVITLQSSNSFNGYYWNDKYVDLSSKAQFDEICLNTSAFYRGDKDVLSTLVHEMVHMYDVEFGKPGKGNYHGKSWGTTMLQIGLIPICNGIDGKINGSSCSHRIEENGKFDLITNELISTNNFISFSDRLSVTFDDEGNVIEKPTTRTKGRNNKITYKCECGNSVYGKANLNIICDDCNTYFIAL